MKKHYDIAVIGSGLGGLVSALILAKEGKKVCVLEKNIQYGGNLQTFSRDKLIFDTGVHYLGGLAPGQNLYQYFSFLDIIDKLDLTSMDKDGYDIIRFDDDARSYPHAQGYENFVDQLSVLFPQERHNLEKYCHTLQSVCRQFPRYHLLGDGQYESAVLGLNNKAFIESITSNKRLQAVLCGSNFLYTGAASTDPMYLHALTVHSYIQSAYRCDKGGSQISKLLVQQLRAHGADLFKRATVTQLEVTEPTNTITALHTKEGKRITADQFISNIDIRSLLNIEGPKFRKTFVQRVEEMPPTVSCFSVYIVLQPKTIPFFNHNIYHFKDANAVWSATTDIPSDHTHFYMLSAIADKKNGKYAESLTVLTYMNYEEVAEWEDTYNTVAIPTERGTTYEQFKQEKANQIIAKISEQLPSLNTAIKEVYTSTPLSYRDYIGNHNGNMYGYIKDADHPMRTLISPRTKISNLFLTGQTINMHGILGVTIGAFSTCEAILGKEKTDEMLRPFYKEIDS